MLNIGKKRTLDLKKKKKKTFWPRIHIKICGVDLEIVMANQKPLHRNQLSQEKTLNFKRGVQTTCMKESNSLFPERVTVMTSAASEESQSTLNLDSS